MILPPASANNSSDERKPIAVMPALVGIGDGWGVGVDFLRFLCPVTYKQRTGRRSFAAKDCICRQTLAVPAVGSWL
jgi:hypothetical protein